MNVFYFFKGRALVLTKSDNILESELGEEPLVLSSVVSLLKQLLDGLQMSMYTLVLQQM